MIKVYFEYGSLAEHVASFEDEKIYDACRPALAGLARECRGTITESITEENLADKG